MNSVRSVHLLTRCSVEGYVIIAFYLIDSPSSASYARILAPDVRLLMASDYPSN